MSRLKVTFLILILVFGLSAIVSARDSENFRFRQLTPLSTNVKPHQIRNFEETDEKKNQEVLEDRHRLNVENYRKELESALEQPKLAMEHVRKSKRKMGEIEREILKRNIREQRELKKFLADLDREHKKYIAEMEREKRRLLVEIEREYRRNLKELEVD